MPEKIEGILKRNQSTGRIQIPKKFRDGNVVVRSPNSTHVYQGRTVQGYFDTENPEVKPNFISFKKFGEDPEYYRVKGLLPFDMVHDLAQFSSNGGFCSV